MGQRQIYKQNVFFIILYVMIILIATAIVTLPTFIVIYAITGVWVNLVYIYIFWMPFMLLLMNKYTIHFPIKITVNEPEILLQSLLKEYKFSENDLVYISEKNILFNTVHIVKIHFKNKDIRVYLNSNLYNNNQDLITFIKDNNELSS